MKTDAEIAEGETRYMSFIYKLFIYLFGENRVVGWGKWRTITASTNIFMLLSRYL